MHKILNGKNDNWNSIGKWWLKKYDQIYNTEYFFDWSIPKKSSTLKPLGQMNRNVVGSIYGRHSIKIVNFGSVNKQFVLVSVHLDKRFQRRRFLEINQSEIRIAYGGHVC
jgi:hypothetical protein